MLCQKLYSMEYTLECGQFPCRGRFSTLSTDDLVYLGSDVLVEEIKKAFLVWLPQKHRGSMASMRNSTSHSGK